MKYKGQNVEIGTTTPGDLFQVGDGINKTVLGGLGSNSNLGWSTSYIGFNAFHDAYNTRWVLKTDNSHNGGGVIMNNISGSMIFIPVGSSTDVSVDQNILEGSRTFYNKRVMELMPIGAYSTNEGMLAINGMIMAKEVIITTDPGTFVWWPDYVFDKKYNLMPINELEKYLKKNKHLPDVPSSNDIIKKGVNVEEMDATLLKKIEELTLYVIDLKKQNDEMQKKNEQLENRINKLEK